MTSPLVENVMADALPAALPAAVAVEKLVVLELSAKFPGETDGEAPADSRGALRSAPSALATATGNEVRPG